MKPYAVYVNVGSHLTAEWKLDRLCKTQAEAEAREKLLLEHYEVAILEGVKPLCRSSNMSI